MTEERLDEILTKAYDNFPDDSNINEIEFSVVGYYKHPTNGLVCDPKWNLGIAKFSSVLKSFIKSTAKPEPKTMLTIGIPDTTVRVRIEDLEDIRLFCMNNNVPKEAKYETKVKKSHDLTEYGVRINYATETPIVDEEHKHSIADIIKDKAVREKTYRYAQRYSVLISDKLGQDGIGSLRVDFTSVRQGKANDFRNAYLTGITATAVEKYEIEIELTNIKKEALKKGTDCYSRVRDCLKRILVPIHGGVTIGCHSTKVKAMKDYVALCNTLWQLPVKEVPDLSAETMISLSNFFVAPKISTMDRDIHIKSNVMLPSDTDTDKYYFFTDKADGQHAILFIDGSGKCFVIVNSPISGKKSFDVAVTIYQTDLTIDKYQNCILDGEYMQVGPSYYYMIFDILTARTNVKGVLTQHNYTGSENFFKREKAFKNISGNNEMFTVISKTFIKYDLKQADNKFKNFIEKLQIDKNDDDEIIRIKYQNAGILYDLDGLVFQPNSDVYPNPKTNSNTWFNTIKWKPKRFLTVDLRVSTMTKGFSKTNSVNIGLVSNTDDVQAVDYTIFQAEYYNIKYIVSEYPLYAPIISGVPRSEAGEPIRNGDIVECRLSFKGNPHWEPVRVRYDKQTPNGLKAYASTLKMILNPITIEQLEKPGGGLGADLAVNVINRFLSNSNIINYVSRIKDPIKALDLGSGPAKSGNAWKHLKLLKPNAFRVIGVDKINKETLDTGTIFMSGLKDTNDKTVFDRKDYDFYTGDFTLPLHIQNDNNDKKISTELAMLEQFNSVVCVFAIHYAMSSEESFRTFLANVSRNLKKEGIFVGSYMNRSKVLDLFKDKKDKKDNKVCGHDKDKDKRYQIWSITYNARDENTSLFGQEILVNIQGLYVENKEYLIDLADIKLLELMKEYGLELLYHEPFSLDDVKGRKKERVKDITPAQRSWFNLQYNFGFIKTKSFNDYEPLFNFLPNGLNEPVLPDVKLKPVDEAKPVEDKPVDEAKPVEDKPVDEAKPKLKIKVKNKQRPAL